jgi:hypothetical protein
LGATIRKVADSKLRKKDDGTEGLSMGALAGAMGLIDEVPFVHEMFDLNKVRDQKSVMPYLRLQAASMIEPQALQWLARQMDKDMNGEVVSRRATTFWEELELGIPGLRGRVPEKKK